MGLGIPVVWDERHWFHRPDGEIWAGVRVPSADTPDRITALRHALEAAGAGLQGPSDHGDAPLERIHDPAYLRFLAEAYDEWVAAGLVEDPGQNRVVPTSSPCPSSPRGARRRCPPRAGPGPAGTRSTP